MECSEPGTIRDEELVAYLAGEKVRPAVVQHLTRCQRCSSQLATYRRIELKLISKLYRWDCPPNQILGEYQMGMLSSEQALNVKNHLRMCVLCAAEVATLTEFLAHDRMLAEPVSVYSAEDVSISIQIERGPSRKDSLQLIGFVTRQGTTLEAMQGTPVRLSTLASTGKTVYTQNIDELGNFVFSSLVPATYTLELQLPEGIVVIDQLPVTTEE